MLKLFAIFGGGLVVAVVAVLAIAATRPDTFQVQRQSRIQAPPEKIFALISDLRGWRAWSPWEKKDPAMRRTFSGPDSGPGAIYAWDGNKDVGAGRMEIVGVRPAAQLTIKLDFSRPFEAHNMVVFELEPAGDTTIVTWTMRGPAPFVAKMMHLFINMDRMVGRDFEAGLASLKALTET